MDMEQLYGYVPRELVTFILVTLFSLLIGLSQRRISLKREGETTLFGTDRTFTFIGILGYLLYILDPTGMRLFMGGGAVLGLLLGLNSVSYTHLPAIDRFDGIYVGIEQDSRLLQVKHGAKAPHIITLASGLHTFHFNIILQEVCGLSLFPAKRRDTD